MARDQETRRATREEDLLEVATDLEDRAAVWEAVDRLTERCRSLLTLLHLAQGDKSYQDAADQLGMPLGSVGPTRQRCLEKLARLLESRFDG